MGGEGILIENDSTDGATLGAQLRQLRRMNGLTLNEVASAVGLSHNFLSMVERGMTDMSLSRFLRLAQFYKVSPSQLLPDPENQLEPRVAGLADGVEIDRGPGVTYQLLPNRELGVQVVYCEMAPGSSFRESLSHAGSDFIWMIEGTLVLCYGNSEHVLSAETCTSYRGRVRHRLENRGDVMARFFGLVTASYW